MTIVSDIIASADKVMGAKAVYGPIHSHVLCFGGRGSRSDTRYFSVPAGAARKAVDSPWVFAVGGGANVRDGYDGRAINLARLSCVYGDTSAFVDEEEAKRLEQWPVAIALHDVWELKNHPLLIEDLGLPDRRILAGAQDGIIKPSGPFEQFWEAISSWEIELVDLPQHKDFHDAGVPKLVSTLLPKLQYGSVEGRERWKLQREKERDRSLSTKAKMLNKLKYGKLTCEACKFENDEKGLFDAHHPNPLASGIRTTLPTHLIVLCPICHRKAHVKEPLSPLSLSDLRQWSATGRN